MNQEKINIKAKRGENKEGNKKGYEIQSSVEIRLEVKATAGEGLKKQRNEKYR